MREVAMPVGTTDQPRRDRRSAGLLHMRRRKADGEANAALIGGVGTRCMRRQSIMERSLTGDQAHLCHRGWIDPDRDLLSPAQHVVVGFVLDVLKSGTVAAACIEHAA